MINFLKKILGIEKKEQQLLAALKQGASIIDVRTSGEFNGGHIKGSKNIPLHQIGAYADKLKKAGQPVIVCCASGMRSAQAKSVLAHKGIEVYNGGSWSSLKKLIQH